MIIYNRAKYTYFIIKFLFYIRYLTALGPHKFSIKVDFSNEGKQNMLIKLYYNILNLVNQVNNVTFHFSFVCPLKNHESNTKYNI